MITVDRRVLADRRKRVEADLAEQGYDALVLFAQGSAVGSSSKSHGYMRFLCDWDGYNTNSVLVLRPGCEPVLVVSNIFLKFMSEKTVWIRDTRLALPPALAGAVVNALQEGGRPARRIAYIGRAETPVPFWEGLREGLGREAEFTDYENRVDPLRVIKDAMQYTVHQRGAEICDAMFSELQRQIKLNKPTYRLQADLERTARETGAEHVLTWLTVAPAADYSRFRREECLRVPQPGDQVILGIYLLYQGHWAHALRMGTFGEPSAAQSRAFAVVTEMEEAGLAALKPGGNLYDVNRAFEKTLDRHFTRQEQAGIFRFRAAHGLGHSYEDPIVSAPFPQPYAAHAPQDPDAFLEIRPGMLFEFHPNYFQPGVSGGAVGDMVYVGEKGPEILNAFPRQHIRWDK